MALVVFFVGVLGSLWLKVRLSVDNPGGVHADVAEILHTLDEPAWDLESGIC